MPLFKAPIIISFFSGFIAVGYAQGNYKDLLVEQSDYSFIQNYLKLSKRERLQAQGEYLKTRPSVTAINVFEKALTRDGINLLSPQLETRLNSSSDNSKPLRIDSIFEGGIIYLKVENLPCKSPSNKKSANWNLDFDFIKAAYAQNPSGPSSPIQGKKIWEKTWWDDTLEFLCPSTYPLVQEYFCNEFAPRPIEPPKPQNPSPEIKTEPTPAKPSNQDPPKEQPTGSQDTCIQNIRMSVGFNLRNERKSKNKKPPQNNEKILFEGTPKQFQDSFNFTELKVKIYKYLENKSNPNQEPWLLPLSAEKFNRQKALFIFLQAESLLPTETPGNICSLNQKILDRMKLKPDAESLKICLAEKKNLQNSSDQNAKPLTRVSLRRSSALNQLPLEAQSNHEILVQHFEVILGFLHYSTSEGLNPKEVQFFNRLQNAIEQNLSSEIMGELWPFWRATLKNPQSEDGGDLEARIAMNIVEKLGRGERSRLVAESERIRILQDLSGEFGEILNARKIQVERRNPKEIPEPLVKALKDHSDWTQFVELIAAEFQRRGL